MKCNTLDSCGKEAKYLWISSKSDTQWYYCEDHHEKASGNVQGWATNHWSWKPIEGDVPAVAAKKCICDLMALMRVGCKCGGS